MKINHCYLSSRSSNRLSVLSVLSLLLVSITLLLCPLAAHGATSSTTGTFCVSGVVSHVANEHDLNNSSSLTQCGQLTTNIITVAVDLDSSSRVYVYKGFSPDGVLCAARNLQKDQSVTFCGNLTGYLLNAGTVNETAGWILYPQGLSVVGAGRTK